MSAARWALLALVALGGCKEPKRRVPPPRPAPMAAAEVSRGRAACDDLVARLCACAAAHPERANVVEACALKKAKPEALALMIETAMRDDVAPDAVQRAQQGARTIIDKCISEVAALPSLGC